MLFGGTDEIKFGTSGWRAIVGKGFNDRNILRVAQGMAEYLRSSHGSGKVVVGYDARPTSLHAANLACGILTQSGFEVSIADAAVPTPVAIWYVIKSGAVGGIIATASHNPMSYNGLKFVVEKGVPASDEVTNSVVEKIPKNPPKPAECGGAKASIKDEYLLALSQMVDLSKVIGAQIAIDPMFSAGVGYLSHLLTTHGANVVEIRNTTPPPANFSPEPKKENLSELISIVKENGALLGLANDGDADRCVAVDDQGDCYAAHQIGLILADYMYRFKGAKGPIVRSFVANSAIDNLAKKYGVKCIETNVGFKYLAAELINGASIGIEESGGIGFGWWIPDKDGIATGAFLADALTNQGKTLRQLWQELSQEYGYGEFLQYDLPMQDKYRALLASLASGQSVFDLAGKRILNKRTADGVKFYLDDGSWVAARESKTEAKLRVYMESGKREDLIEISKAINRLFGVPESTGIGTG